MTLPRRPQHDLRGLPAHKLREQQDHNEKEVLERKIQFYLEIGPIRSWGFQETRCQKCGIEARPNKTYCQGRKPEAGLEAKCYVVGEHNHCVCPGCEFAWLERCKDDESDDPMRGPLRADEVRSEDGSIMYVAVPDVHERWGVPRPAKKEA